MPTSEPQTLSIYLDPADVLAQVGLGSLREEDQAAFGSVAARMAYVGRRDLEEEAESMYALVGRLYEQDLTEYFDAFTQTMEALVAERDDIDQVDVIRDTHGRRFKEHGPLATELYELAVSRTPFTATGQPPDLTVSPAEEARAIGSTYAARVYAIATADTETDAESDPDSTSQT